MVVEDLGRIKSAEKDNGGPLGLGDPNDRTLRKVEVDVLIPKKMRDKARLEKCIQEVADFNKCCKENGFFMMTNCRKENNVMKDCYAYWFTNSEFREICTEEYLKERAEFRTTGIVKRIKRGTVNPAPQSTLKNELNSESLAS